MNKKIEIIKESTMKMPTNKLAAPKLISNNFERDHGDPGYVFSSYDEIISDPQITTIRLILKSYDPILLNNSCHQLIESIKSNGDIIKGPVPLPTKRRIYCVLRSPHVNKDSREHFEIRTHKRLIDLHLRSESSLRKMKELDLPSGVYLMRKK
jgi:small subunit ribosomal protein S10